MSDTDLLDRVEVSQAPAKLWRNWYRSPIDHLVGDPIPVEVRPPGTYPGSRLYPSKDIAETHWHEHVAKHYDAYIRWKIEYAGARPEEE